MARQRIQHATVSAETGIGDEEFWAEQTPALSRAMESGAYPAMASLSEDAFSGGWEESFEFGLQRVLDGINALVAARRAGSRPKNRTRRSASSSPR